MKEIVITKYQCSHCLAIFKTPKECEEHENKCRRNTADCKCVSLDLVNYGGKYEITVTDYKNFPIANMEKVREVANVVCIYTTHPVSDAINKLYEYAIGILDRSIEQLLERKKNITTAVNAAKDKYI